MLCQDMIYRNYKILRQINHDTERFIFLFHHFSKKLKYIIKICALHISH